MPTTGNQSIFTIRFRRSHAQTIKSHASIARFYVYFCPMAATRSIAQSLNIRQSNASKASWALSRLSKCFTNPTIRSIATTILRLFTITSQPALNLYQKSRKYAVYNAVIQHRCIIFSNKIIPIFFLSKDN